MSKKRIQTLEKYPEIFGTGRRPLPAGWPGDYIIVRIPKPDNLPIGDPTGNSPWDIIERNGAEIVAGGWPDEISDTGFTEIAPGSWPGSHQPGAGIWPNPNYTGYPVSSSGATSSVGGKTGGSGTTTGPSSAPVNPPSDCLAFYLPFHYFGADWWGVYLTIEGVIKLARYIYTRSGGAVDPFTSMRVARIFLYVHENFHHRVECFALRFEMTRRQPCYATNFETLYRALYSAASWSEEGLANAAALRTVWTRTKKNRAVQDALEEYVKHSPAGYNKGVGISKRFTAVTHQFAEVHQNDCFAPTPGLPDNLWASTPHFLTGISNVTSRVNYIIPRGAPLAHRLPLK